MDSIAMKNGQHHDHIEQYGVGQWVEINGYHSPQHQSPVHEYSNAYGYMSPAHIPMDANYNRSIPPPYSTHQPIQPLWPSMLTNPSNSPTPGVPPNGMPVHPPLAPLSTITAPAVPMVSIPTTAPAARRTLTDHDRRRMCQYHEDNPTVKQTEIGAMFGVERSTVSKVLRQKDKYLFPDDGSRSPIKRAKGKFPDIERALSNWARNHQRQGLPLNDNMIRDKARFFATTVGSSESSTKVTSSSWLEKFKQKNHLLEAKSRKGSEATDSDCGLNADPKSGSQTPNGISPISPLTTDSPSSMSPGQSHDSLKTESPDGYLDFNDYRHGHSQSATSLTSAFSDNLAPSSFSVGPASPTSPFFSPDPSSGASPFIQSQRSRLPPLAPAPPFADNAARPRSQTFPMVGVEPSYITPPASSEPLTPKYLNRAINSPVLESPVEEMSDPMLSIDVTMENQTPTSTASMQEISPTSMGPPPHPKSNPRMSSPSPEEAHQALQLLLKFCERQPSGLVEPQDFVTMGKLMEKLKIHGAAGGTHSMAMAGDGPEGGRLRRLSRNHSL